MRTMAKGGYFAAVKGEAGTTWPITMIYQYSEGTLHIKWGRNTYVEYDKDWGGVDGGEE